MSDYTLNIIVQADDRASGPLQSSANALTNMATVAGGIIGANALGGIADGMKAAVAGAMDFESGMNRFASVTGLAQQQLSEFSALFMKMGAETQYSAAQAQQAAIELAKGGIAPAIIAAGGLESAMALAAAGELELATAAEISAKQLGVWVSTSAPAGEQTAFLADAANLLSQAANASTVGVEELALGMANVGGIAKTTGLSFEETVQTMAMIAPGFSSAADAGTSLKVMLSRLQPTTKPAIEAFQSLGLISTDYIGIAQDLGVSLAAGATQSDAQSAAVRALQAQLGGVGTETKAFQEAWAEVTAGFQTNAFYDAQGNFVGMESAAQSLQVAMQGLSEAEKTAALQAMFGQDAFRAAALIAENGAVGFTNMGAAMANAGSAVEQAAQRNQGLAFAMDSLMGTVETLGIVLGGMVTPALTTFAQAITQVLGVALSFAAGTSLTMEQLTGLATALNAVVPGMGTFAAQILASSNPLQALVAAISTVVPGFDAFAAGVAAAAGAMAPLVAALGGNLTPIIVGLAGAIGVVLVGAIASLIISAAAAAAPFLALAAVIAALYAAWTSNFLGIQQIVASVMGAIVPLVTAGVALISSAWQQHGGQVLAFVQTSWSQIASIAQGALQLYQAYVVAYLGATLAFLTTHGAQILGIIQGAWMMVSGVVGAALSLISGVIQAALAAINGDWQGAWSILVETAGAVLSNLGTVVAGALQIVVNVFAIAWSLIASAMAAAWAGIVSTFLSMTAPIVAGVTALVTSIGEGFAALGAMVLAAFDGIAAAISTAMATISSVMVAAWAGIVAVWDSVVVGLSAGVATLLAGFAAGFEQLGAIVLAAFAGVEALVAGAWAAIQTAFTAGAALIMSVWAGLWAMLPADVQTNLIEIAAIAGEFWNILTTLFSVGFAAVVAAAQAGMQFVTTAFMTGWAAVAAAVAVAWSAIVAAVDAGIALVSSTISTGIAVVSSVMMAGWTVVATAVQTAWTLISSVVMAGIELVVSNITTGIAIVSSVMMAGWAVVATAVQTAWTTISSVVMAGIALVVSNISAGIAVVSSVMAAGWALVVAGASAVWTTIASGVSAGWAQIVGAVNIGIAAIKGAWATFAATAASLGRDLIDGIARGVSAGMSVLTNAVKNAAQSALNAAKSLLGIHSPSTVFANEVGGPMAQGVAQGFTAHAPEIMGAVKSGLADAVEKIATVVEKAVAALSKLAGFGGVGAGSMSAFQSAMQRIVQVFVELGAMFHGPALKGAVTFAESAGKIVGILEQGVKALHALGTFTGISLNAIGAFAATLRLVVTYIAQVASEFDALGVAHAAKFSESAGKILTMIASGVDAINKLGTFAGINLAAIGNFAATLRLVVTYISVVAGEFSGVVMERSAAFSDSAAKVLQMVGAGVDSINKLGTFKGINLAAIGHFAATLRIVVNHIAVVAHEFSVTALEQSAKFSDAAGKVLGMISSGVDAITKLGTFKGINLATIGHFAATLRQVVTYISVVAHEFSTSALQQSATFSEAASKVVALVGQGVDGLTKLDSYKGTATSAIQAFAAAVQQLVALIAQAATAFTVEALAHSQRFSEAAQKAVALLGQGVDGLAKLETYKGTSTSTMQAFVAAVHQLVALIAQASTAFTVEGLAHSQKFSEAASKAVAILGQGVDGLTKLETYKGTSTATMQAFVAAVHQLVALIAQASTAFSVEGLAHSIKFSEAAAKAVAMLGQGVEGLTKLETYKGTSTATMQAFVAAVQQLVALIAQAATAFTVEGLAHSQKFSEAAGKAVTILGQGVEGLTKLDAYKGTSDVAMQAFVASIERLITQIASVSYSFSVEALTHAQKFADSAGKVVGIIGSGVDGLTKLAGFKAPADAAIAAFSSAVQRIFAALGAVANQFSVEAIAHAQKFADSAGKAVAVVGSGVDALSKLATFKGAPEAAIALFAAALRTVYTKLAEIANEFAGEAISKATLFAESAAKVITLVGQGVDNLKKLSEFKGVDGAGLQAFAASVHKVIATLVQLANEISGEAVAKTREFATATSEIVSLVKSTMDDLRSLGGGGGGDGGAGSVFGAVVTFGNSIGKAASQVRAGLGDMTSALKSAAGEASSTVKGMTSDIESGFRSMVDAVRSGLAAMVDAARSGFAQMADAARSGIASMVDAIRSGIGGATDAVRSGIAGMVSAAQSGFSQLAAAARSVVPVFSSVGSAASSMAGTVRSAMSSAASAAGSMASSISGNVTRASSSLSRLSSAVRSVPKMPSVSVPGFATGTAFAPGGMALVGERGPELVNLPRGSRVHTSAASRHMMGQGGGDTYQFYFEGRESSYTRRDIIDIVREAMGDEGNLGDIRRRMRG